jgi:AcrR family transcriptional regulator
VRARDPAKERAIREAALSLIVETGFDGLSMQKVAEAAKVSPATIYIYFQDREDLIFRLYEEVSARMAELTLEGFDPGMSFPAGLRLQWKNRARYSLEHPDEAHFIEQMKHSPHAERCAKLKNRFTEVMGAFVDNAVRRGELVAMPVEVYWSVAFAPLYQLVRFHRAGRGLGGRSRFVLDDKVLEQTLNLVLKALEP